MKTKRSYDEDEVKSMLKVLGHFWPNPHPSLCYRVRKKSGPLPGHVDEQTLTVRDAITVVLATRISTRACDIVEALERWRPTKSAASTKRSRYWGEFDADSRFIAPRADEPWRNRSLGRCKFNVPVNKPDVPFYRVSRGQYAVTGVGYSRAVGLIAKVLGDWFYNIIFGRLVG